MLGRPADLWSSSSATALRRRPICQKFLSACFLRLLMALVAASRAFLASALVRPDSGVSRWCFAGDFLARFVFLAAMSPRVPRLAAKQQRRSPSARTRSDNYPPAAPLHASTN